jgi:hypothetical protein
MAKKFIPRNDKEFENFFRNITDYVIDNNARWKHIQQNDMDEIESQFSIWMKAYEPVLVPHSPQLTAEKNRNRTAKEPSAFWLGVCVMRKLHGLMYGVLP